MSPIDPELDVADVTVRDRATAADYGVSFAVAGLSSIVGFKRLAGRPRDRNDLAALEEIHGELPIAGVDDQ